MTHNGHPSRADSYSCHDFKSESPQTTITAGESLDLAWTFEDWYATQGSNPRLADSHV